VNGAQPGHEFPEFTCALCLRQHRAGIGDFGLLRASPRLDRFRLCDRNRAGPADGKGAVLVVLSVAGLDWFSVRRSSNSGLQLLVAVAVCLADFVDAGAEQPGSRRRSHHPERGERE
jgi:hypothetical protein